MYRLFVLVAAILVVEADETNLLDFFCSKVNWNNKFPIWAKCADAEYPELAGKSKGCYGKIYEAEVPKSRDDILKAMCEADHAAKKIKEWNDCLMVDWDATKGTKVAECFDKQVPP
ncbi:hypothetical protein HDE_11872 [Halotydeus destructor]|nr:hypothetical protein HDE_11872 [Halotydeus destructor]